MALKLKQLATVDEHFLGLEKQIYQEWRDQEKEQAAMWPGGERQYMDINKLRLARIARLLRGENGDGRSGVGYEITKLRGLPFSLFTAYSFRETLYLMGQTHPIIIHHRGEVYDLGPYEIHISTEVILNGNLNKIHMIPKKAPLVSDRFMHHTAYPQGETYPLAYKTNTCWGDFGSTINSFVVDADIPELFRGLQVYLSRYNAASPLKSIERLSWDTRTPWEKYHAN